MATVSAFKHGAAALRANPVLLVPGFLLGIVSQLQYVDQLIDSPLLSAGVSLAWLVGFPFVLAGFIGMARAAIKGTDVSLTRFVTEGRTHYRRLLLSTVLFLLLVLGTAIGLGLLGFVFGIASIALAAINEMAAFGAGVGSLLLWLVSILAVILFVQFYDAAIVIESKGITDAFSRSIALVRSNLTSVLGFSLVWTLLLNAFLVPEYLVRLTLTDAAPIEVLPVDLGIPILVLLPLGIGLSALGFTYLYTVYTAYYLQLSTAEPATPESI